jgi:hypothetical protein
MKKINICIVFAALMLASSAVAQQQMTIKTSSMAALPGQEVHLDVQVEDFFQITNIQFALKWDPAVLKFLNVENFGLPNLTPDGNFNLLKTTEGKVRFLWADAFANGITLADMTTIFSLKFKVVGALGSSTSLLVTNDTITPALMIEANNASGATLDVQVQPGTVVVGTTATTESITDDFVLFQNSPNPFTDVTYIRFYLKQPTEGTLSIYDGAGKVIYQKNDRFAAGFHSIPIEGELFQSAGAYLYSLKTAQTAATRQLIAQ